MAGAPKQETNRLLVTIGNASQIEPALKDGNSLARKEPRIAMVGRSNVGKSSLINTLMGGSLARVGKSPGKTRLIHCYLWVKIGKVLVDLPGYGFAKVSMKERKEWAKVIDAYLQADPRIEGAMVLWDARHGPSEMDLEALEFLRTRRIPVLVVLAKADAVKNQKEMAARRKEVGQILNRLGYNPEGAHWVSARTKKGIQDLIQTLSEIGRE